MGRDGRGGGNGVGFPLSSFFFLISIGFVLVINGGNDGLKNVRMEVLWI